MAITYTWSIADLKRNADGGVTEATFQVLADDGTNQATWTSAHEFEPDPSASNFIPYSSITEEIVLNWIHTMIGSDAVRDTEAFAERALADSQLTGTPW